MKNVVFSFFCIFLLFVFMPLQAVERGTQHIDSNSLFSYFAEKGLNPSVLVNKSQSEVFPYNICLDFYPAGVKKTDAVPSFIIAVSQENVPFFLSALTNFALNLQKNPPPLHVTIVCTAGDVSAVPNNKNFLYPEGTHVFVSTLDDTTAVSAVILQPVEHFESRRTQETVTVIPGIPFKAAPMQLLQQLFSAADSSNISIKVMGSFISFYRIGFVHRDATLGEYLDENIPAVLLECRTADVFSLFAPLMDSLVAQPQAEWDFHYSLISFLGKAVFMPEPFLLILLLLFSSIPLVYFIVFSFFDRKVRITHLEDLKKSWFLVPMLAVTTWLLLYCGQLITPHVYPKWRAYPFNALILKGMTAILLLSLVSIVHRWITFPTREYIYGWFLNLIAFADVFIFAAFDLSLIVPFCMQLVLALAATKIKKTFPLILIGLLMLLPFFPFLTALFTIPRQNIPYRFFSASLLENFFIACFVLPAEFMWIRILVRLNIFGRGGKITFPYMVTAMALISIAVIGGILGVTAARERIFPQRNLVQKEENTTGLVHCEYEVSTFMNRARVDIVLTADTVPLKYEITVSSKTGFAVFDANFPFDSSDLNKTVSFVLSEFPPNPFELKYTCEKNSESTVEVTAFLRRIDGAVITETKKITILTEGD